MLLRLCMVLSSVCAVHCIMCNVNIYHYHVPLLTSVTFHLLQTLLNPANDSYNEKWCVLWHCCRCNQIRTLFMASYCHTAGSVNYSPVSLSKWCNIKMSLCFVLTDNIVDLKWPFKGNSTVYFLFLCDCIQDK